MGTLASELAPHADRVAGRPRVYVDANVPARLVSLMRTVLHWDVLFVIEHDELRRAPDLEHFRRARDFGRTLLTLDHDYLNSRHFPPARSGGVVVMTAPSERGYQSILRRLDAEVLRASVEGVPPLAGRTLHVDVDWPGPVAPAAPRRRRS